MSDFYKCGCKQLKEKIEGIVRIDYNKNEELEFKSFDELIIMWQNKNNNDSFLEWFVKNVGGVATGKNNERVIKKWQLK